MAVSKDPDAQRRTTPATTPRPTPGAPGAAQKAAKKAAPFPSGTPSETGWSNDAWATATGTPPGLYMPEDVALGYSLFAFKDWYSQAQANPNYVNMASAYGPEFERFAWESEINHWDEGKIQDYMRKKGWTWIVQQPKGPSYRGGSGGSGGATKDQQYAGAFASLKNTGETLGLQIDDAGYQSLAKVVVDSNWTNDMVLDYLTGSTVENWDGLKAGTLTATVDQIKEMAAQQLLTVSDDTARQYSKRIASGELDVATLGSIFQQQAKAQYQWAAPVIDQGVSMRDYLMPTRDFIANELEQPADAIDMMDTKWLDMMQTKDDKGVIRAATQREVQSRVRKTGDFAATTKAQNLTASASTMMRQFMGM